MATIIKRELHQHASGTALRDAAYNLTDMEGHAGEYLATVRNEAERIVADARDEAKAIRKQAEVDGRQTAEAAVERILDEKVAQQMTTLKPALETAVAEIVDAQQDWLRHWETAAVNFAAAIASRIVRKELEKTPDISIDWIRDGLTMTAGSSEVTIRLNPGDVDTLGKQTEELATLFRPLGSTRIVGDDEISPGGCRLETEFGSVDQQLETQLARIAEELG